MHAFIGTVPFTIIEAVNYVISNEIKDADLYVVKVFANAEEVGERIKQTGVFKNVYIVEDVLLTYPITLEKCIRTVRNGKGIVNLLKDKKYDYCYYNNSGWLINSIFYTGFYKGNSKVKNVFLEHTYFSYVSDYADKPWYMRFLINAVGLKCMDGTMLEKLCVFEPELVHAKYNGKLEAMKKIDKKNKEILDTLNVAFGYDCDNNQFKDKEIIIMEQGPLKVEFDKEAFWKEVFSCIDVDRTIVKAHPRQKESTLKELGAAVSKGHTTPWEMEILNNDIQNKVQITIFSGSCVSPKLMFGDEPTIIFLYKLLPVDYSFLGTEIMAFANDIGSKYENKDKYFIPESFEELKEFCIRKGIYRKGER